MIYILCIFLPPVAVLLVGKPIQALLNLLLTFAFWVPGVIHAILVVNAAKADKRNQQLLKQSERQHKEAMKAMQQQAERDAAAAKLAAQRQNNPPPAP